MTNVLNGDKEIPESFEKLMYLLKFNASGNQITQLPHTFVNLPYLAELNISGNELWELPEDFGRLAFSLVNLNVSNNKLDKLPASIGTLTRCKSMDFSNNKKGFQVDSIINAPLRDPHRLLIKRLCVVIPALTIRCLKTL